MGNSPKQARLVNPGRNDCFINSAVQVIYRNTSLEDVKLAYKSRPNEPVVKALCKLLLDMHKSLESGKASSVSELRVALNGSYKSGLFEERALGDSYQVFNAILQILHTADQECPIANKFILKVRETLECKCGQQVDDWNPDTFGLSVLMNSNSMLAQLKEIFEGKPLAMCLRDKTCNEGTVTSLKLLASPEVFMFQLNYDPSNISQRLDIEESFDIKCLGVDLVGNYRLTDVVFMLPGHYITASIDHTRIWRIFNDSSVTQLAAISFSEVMRRIPNALPYMLAYRKGPNKKIVAQEPNEANESQRQKDRGCCIQF